MNRWRTLPYSTGTAAEQLARSDALRGGEPNVPTLRWYGYSAPALVLGVGQHQDEADERACAAAGVAVVRRQSGGTAVYVGPDTVALDVLLPTGHPLAGRDVVQAYRWVGECFAAALRALAPSYATAIEVVDVATARADASLQRSASPHTPEAQRGRSCFATLSPFEVALASPAGGPPRKLVGLSQVRKRSFVLHQAGLYLRHSGAVLSELLAGTADERRALARELDRRIASLADVGVDAAGLGALVDRFSRCAAARLAHAEHEEDPGQE